MRDQLRNPSAALQALINEAAAKYQLDPRLLQAVMQSESNYNPSARNPNKKTDEIGLMQLTRDTRKTLGLSDQDAFDPRKNTLGGAQWLRQKIDAAGSIPAGVMAYNGAGDPAKQYAVNVLNLYGAPPPGFDRTWSVEEQRSQPPPPADSTSNAPPSQAVMPAVRQWLSSEAAAARQAASRFGANLATGAVKALPGAIQSGLPGAGVMGEVPGVSTVGKMRSPRVEAAYNRAAQALQHTLTPQGVAQNIGSYLPGVVGTAYGFGPLVKGVVRGFREPGPGPYGFVRQSRTAPTLGETEPPTVGQRAVRAGKEYLRRKLPGSDIYDTLKILFGSGETPPITSTRGTRPPVPPQFGPELPSHIQTPADRAAFLRQNRPIQPVFPGAPFPQHPGVFPGAPFPEHRGVFPGAPFPAHPGTFPGAPFPEHPGTFSKVPLGPEWQAQYPGAAHPQLPEHIQTRAEREAFLKLNRPPEPVFPGAHLPAAPEVRAANARAALDQLAQQAEGRQAQAPSIKKVTMSHPPTVEEVKLPKPPKAPKITPEAQQRIGMAERARALGAPRRSVKGSTQTRIGTQWVDEKTGEVYSERTAAEIKARPSRQGR